jgi:hypothetical protein
MKLLIAVLGGFVTTLMVFGGGVAFAVFYLTAKPVPIQHPNTRLASTWTQQAVRVDKAAQDYERLPAQAPAVASAPAAAADKDAASATSVDPMTTAAVATDTDSGERPTAGLDTAHLEWCASRYRSYDPADDSYMAYSGVRRRCVSPHDGQAAIPDGSNDPAGSSVVVSDAAYGDQAASGFPDPGHVQSCFDRYRSYRPEDNTYQPYSGGPRRQCE